MWVIPYHRPSIEKFKLPDVQRHQSYFNNITLACTVLTIPKALGNSFGDSSGATGICTANFEEQYLAAGRGAKYLEGFLCLLELATAGLGLLSSDKTSSISESKNFDTLGLMYFNVGGTGFALIYCATGLTILSISTTELNKPLLEPKSSGDENILPDVGVILLLF